MLKTNFDTLVARLSPDEKASLRLLIDLPGKSLDPKTEQFFSQHPWAGVILFPKNIETKQQVQTLIAKLQDLNSAHFPDHPLFVAVDQEGGSVSPLEAFVTSSPGNMALAASEDADAVYHLARQNGAELRSLGFNVNFSPVVDVNINPQNPIIGIRSFGEDPSLVAKLGVKAVQGYQEVGVMATAKHFPGHGDTAKDSHLDLPYVDANEMRLRKVEFFPFQEVVSNGVWGVMTAHVVFPALDKKPATLSKKILTGILRNEMGFEGIIFTDSFAMSAIQEHYDLEEAVFYSIKAGADVLLALGDFSSQLEIFEILKTLIRKKNLPPECIDTPLARIFSFREKLSHFPKPLCVPQWDNVKGLHEKCVTWVKKEATPPIPLPNAIFLSPEATPKADVFRTAFKETRFILWPWREKPQKGDWLFLGEKRLLLPECQNVLQEFSCDFQCVVAFGNPYLLKLLSAPIQLTTYHFNEIFVQCVYEVLVHGKSAPGKLPITLG
jgi:beta-glucosidase-like glycosyl hydrolase